MSLFKKNACSLTILEVGNLSLKYWPHYNECSNGKINIQNKRIVYYCHLWKFEVVYDKFI